MTHTDAERAAWKSDRETLERDALAFLRLEERSVEELNVGRLSLREIEGKLAEVGLRLQRDRHCVAVK